MENIRIGIIVYIYAYDFYRGELGRVYSSVVGYVLVPIEGRVGCGC